MKALFQYAAAAAMLITLGGLAAWAEESCWNASQRDLQFWEEVIRLDPEDDRAYRQRGMVPPSGTV